MKKLFESLWNAYREDYPIVESEEEKRLIAQLEECESVWIGWNEEQKRIVQRIEDCWEERCCIIEKEAFEDGFRFATLLWNEVFFQGSKEP